MITNIDPYLVWPSTFAAQSAVRAPSTRHPAASRDSRGGLSQSRAARESSFEQAHGSLWVPGLLDRLTSPLTRYHE
jgi:hypothetical protein